MPMTCAEFQLGWQARQDRQTGNLTPAEWAHVNGCEQCSALHEAGEVLSLAIQDWRRAEACPARSSPDRGSVRRQRQIMGQLSQLSGHSLAVPARRGRERLSAKRHLAAIGLAVAAMALVIAAPHLSTWRMHTARRTERNAPGTTVVAAPPAEFESTNAASPLWMTTDVVASARRWVEVASPRVDIQGIAATRPPAETVETADSLDTAVIADLEPIRREMETTLNFLWLASSDPQ